MFDFQPDPDQPKAVLYDDLLSAAGALVAGERDPVANMANIAALLWQFLPDLNWAGFYRMVDGQLVLGPFVGKPACIRIAVGSGVCGTAVSERCTQLVDDVEAFPGHIACDGETKSELVVPVMANDEVIAVIDLDSPSLARFDQDDRAGIEALAQRIAPAVSG
ncbi:GAF domain-containing protein [Alteriqipengyuania flavescens]|uniref:GAF domain-containing protein n=1 Tax=Alteriqipengyuania flavescens TaxID=3053610 RepID=UPI0025B3FBE7|nr:GAF domain-containing protein [Alteriqipengyuania flavescens]WJY20013.1 GAF domain-containing protein [Alteriqipengyuania flavescens]WJY25957.1 GAF domain-containing protein [Alteriqipengyuania flavescens]